MTKEQIKAIQEEVGTYPDGIWGSDSIKKCQAYLRKLMPIPNPWPDPRQTALKVVYGQPGDESQLINLPLPDDVIVKYEGKQVKTIRCHKKVGPSLGRILRALSEEYPEVLLDYAGCFNNRSIRGGSTPSLHAYGAAIDFMPGTNGNHTHWPTKANMPFGVMKIFAKEGWLPAGAFWHRDAMHFQCSR